MLPSKALPCGNSSQPSIPALPLNPICEFPCFPQRVANDRLHALHGDCSLPNLTSPPQKNRKQPFFVLAPYGPPTTVPYQPPTSVSVLPPQPVSVELPPSMATPASVRNRPSPALPLLSATSDDSLPRPRSRPEPAVSIPPAVCLQPSVFRASAKGSKSAVTPSSACPFFVLRTVTVYWLTILQPRDSLRIYCYPDNSAECETANRRKVKFCNLFVQN